MKTNRNISHLKYKFLKPLLMYTIIFLLFLFTLLNLILKYSFSLSNSIVTDKILFNINIILITIIIIFLIGFIFITILICNSLSKSIMELSNDTKKIVSSTYSTDNIKMFNYKEIQDLNISIHKLAKKLFYYHNSQKATIANASHELRTPLMSIQGYAEAIKHNIFEDINEPLDIIINESIHLRDLINSILRLSEMDSHSLKVKNEEINLYKTLNRMANGLRGLAFKEGKKICVNGDKSINIHTDEKLLEEAVKNIISNGIRYAKEKVSITFEKTNSKVIIHLEDDGQGIAKNDLDNLFIRYYKGDNGNFGLGLSIAQSSINYLNGEIIAYNKENGACFDIILNL